LIGDLQSKIHRQEIKYSALEGETSELRLKIKSTNIFKNQLDNYMQDYETSEKRHLATMDSLSQQMIELETDSNTLASEKSTLLDQNQELQHALARQNLESTKENSKYVKLHSEFTNLQRKFAQQRTSTEILTSLQHQKASIEEDLTRLSLNNSEYLNQMEQMESALLKNACLYEEDQIKSRDESTKLMYKLQQAEVSLNSLRQDNNSLKKDNVELKNHIISLEQLLCVKEDVYSQLNSGLERLGHSQEDCDKLRGRLEASGKVSESQEEKVFE
jgi:chromosome segregation ATPase